MPDYHLEQRLGGRVAGVDEVGRGPLAGPVLAAAVILPSILPHGLAAMLDDSKRLTAGLRRRAFDVLMGHAADGVVYFAVGAASVAEITRLNILAASLLAMQRAVARLAIPPDAALIDGNVAPRVACPAHCVVGGDARSLSIAAASIVAKVVRDRAMARLALRHPCYGWEVNAGYGTASHRAALIAHGITAHHRPTFGLVRKLAAAMVPPPAASVGD